LITSHLALRRFFNKNLIFVRLQTMQINVINTSGLTLPAYETAHAAGMDLRANLTEAVELKPMQRALIPTGLFMEIPVGFEAQVRPRSGLAFKHGITVLNAPGTIDADYRGEVKVLLINLGNDPFVINHGERIAQLIIAKHETISWQVVEELSNTERGAGGYGSTGKQ
jgi:dUTP pyrophosphatase